jgi:OOP family OmpA-OmpF porin
MLIKLALGLVIGSATVGALAQTITDIQAESGNSAYAQDGKGTIVRSPFGLCWRSGYWTSGDAVPGCDGQLAPPVAKITAPPIPAAAPAASSGTIAAAPMPKRCDFTFTLAGDQTFLFNQAALTREAKQRLDAEIASKFGTCSRTDSVLITGHTDRIGTRQYNQKLSEKRAGTVAAYLKSRNSLLNVQTSGAGESQPVQACDGKLDRKRLLECLAPNRRVVIEVKGIAN